MNRIRAFAILLLTMVMTLVLAASAFAEGPPAFAGTVVDADTGEPLPYATVSLFDAEPDDEGLWSPLLTTTTDQWGAFEFDFYEYASGRFVMLWGRTCVARVNRTGWACMMSDPLKMDVQYPYEPADFGVLELQRVPDVTPQSPIYGENRYATALRVSQAAYPLGLDGSAAHITTGTVVIAAGDSWADALLAASVAGVEKAPIILAGVYDPWGYYYYYSPYWDWYDYDPMAEIRRLDPERAIIVGGEDVVPLQAEFDLKIWLGADDVERLWGDDRYGTARAASEYVIDHVSEPATLAVVATGRDFADALAASAVIWRGDLPLYLASVDGLSTEDLDEMAANGITDVMILGGDSAIAPEVEADLVGRLGGAHVRRLGGADRYETSALIADWGVDEYGLDWSHVAFASGQKYADALTGGPLQGGTGSVLLLARYMSIPPAPAAALEANSSEVEEVRFLGGPASLTEQYVWERAREIVDQ